MSDADSLVDTVPESLPDAPCIRYNNVVTGPERYVEITCLYPQLSLITSDWERSPEVDEWIVNVHEYTKEHVYLPAYICAFYFAAVIVGPKIVAGRKCNCFPFLPLWNLFLSVFSAIGFLRTAPMLLHICLNGANPDKVGFSDLSFFSPYLPEVVDRYVSRVFMGLESLFVTKASYSFGSGSCGLWVALFIYSKVPELIDTLFLILRSRKVIFLHWYHHITVLLFCFQSYRLESPSGLVFCVMNYGVHSIMYFYFFLTTIHCRPSFFKPFYVTFLQLSQMFIGMATCCLSAMLYQSYTLDSKPHFIHVNNLIAAFVMYTSYFVLFAKFAWDYAERLGLGWAQRGRFTSWLRQPEPKYANGSEESSNKKKKKKNA